MALVEDGAGDFADEVERIADDLYRQLPFWKIDRSCRGLNILASYDGLSAALGALVVNPDHATDFMHFDDGVSHCLHWNFEVSGCFGYAHDITEDSFRVACNFLNWGRCYQAICDVFRTYRQGLLSVVADRDQKRIRFQYRDSERSSINVASQLEDRRRLDKFIDGKGADTSRVNPGQLRTLLMRAVSVSESRISLTDDSALANSDLVSLMAVFGQSDLWLPLDDSGDLGGYSVADFRAFWSVLHRWSAIVIGAMQLKGLEPGKKPECLPTQVIDSETFKSRIARHSGLSASVIDRISDRLRFRDADSKSDLFMSPIILEDEYVIWSPRCVNNSQYLRNHLKLLVRSPGTKSVADNLLGELESPIVAKVRRKLEQYAYQTKSFTRVSANESGEIDLLAWTNRASNQVLMIEVKFVLPPDDVNETKDYTKKLIAGQAQISKCQRILETLDYQTKHQLYKFVPWESISSYYPLVVSNAGAPSELYDGTDVPWLSLDVMGAALRHRDFRTPRGLWSAAKEQGWLEELEEGEQFWNTMHVAEYQIDIPFLGIGRLEDDVHP